MTNNAPMVRLGELIAQRREKNNNYIVPIRGVTREGFIDPKQKDADLSMYNVFYRNDFVFNPARMEINSIALNTEFDKAICSSLYEIFYVTNTKRLLPEYLNLFLKRDEFARFCLYDAIGSARNYFRVANMQDIQIPLPSIETQRALVAIYDGLQKTIAENEALIKEMESVCHVFVVDCKTKYPKVQLGEWIAQRREKNENYSVPVRGVTKEGFIEPKQKDADLSLYNVFYMNDFVFNPARMEINSIALNKDFEKAICSSLYEVFYIAQTDKLLPEYLNLFLKRNEFARFCEYDAIGSARNYFRVANMQSIEIPLPPIELQRSIAEVFNCLQESKRIVEETRGLMKNLCPALVQKAAHSA